VHDPKFKMQIILDKSEESLWLSKDLSVDQLINSLRSIDMAPDWSNHKTKISTGVKTVAVNGIHDLEEVEI